MKLFSRKPKETSIFQELADRTTSVDLVTVKGSRTIHLPFNLDEIENILLAAADERRASERSV